MALVSAFIYTQLASVFTVSVCYSSDNLQDTHILRIMNITQPDEPSPDNEKYDWTYKAPVDPGNQQELGEANDESMPPKDGGPGAWLFLFGACVFEIVSWGQLIPLIHEFIHLR